MENINFELYKIFYFVAKNKNLTKAAKDLYISQPAISQAIKKLEDELGFKLFYRIKSGMELTKDGEELYDYLKSAIEHLNSGKHHLLDNKKANQIIRIGSGTTLIKYSLIPVLKIFKEKYPDIKFEISRNLTSVLLNKLDNNELDLVLLNVNPDNKDNRQIIEIEQVQDVFCYKKDAFNLDEHKYSMEEINSLPLLLQNESSTSRQFIERIASDEHIILNSQYDLASYGLVIDFIKAGLGVGLVNYNHIKDDVKNGDLVVLNTNFKIPPRKIGICINKKITDNSVIQEFISYLKDKTK